MSRRRYVSTDISLDTKVNRLALEYGDFAALFYTWLTLHVDTHGAISAEPTYLLWVIMPGRRDKEPEDIQRVLDAIQAVGLGTIKDGQLRIDPDLFERRRHNNWRYQIWRAAVFARDKYRCRRCDSQARPLHAHHILAWAAYPDNRYEVGNGLTLCPDCHRSEHRVGVGHA